jgi:hypothetical protein
VGRIVTDRLPELVTTRQLCKETTLPYTTVRSIIRRAVAAGVEPHRGHELRITLWRRADLAPYFTGGDS